MPHGQQLIATLICNPKQPVLTGEIADAAAQSVNATALYWLDNRIACDIPIRQELTEQKALQAIKQVLGKLPIDVVVQQQDQRRKKLLVADMDSTMIEQECIDELAEEAGLREHVAQITTRAMNGEIAFEPALRERVALLKGLPLSIIDHVLEKRITLMPGAKELIGTMKNHGAYTALVSGGFTLFTQKVSKLLGFDENHANHLNFSQGQLTGTVSEPILGKQAKLETLLMLCERLNIEPTDAMAVGDGANDLAMLQKAGSGVALHAKPMVAEAAAMRIDYGDLTALLYIQGYRKTDFTT